MDTTSESFPLNFFDDFVGQVLDIECCSWPYEFAAKIWGTNLAGKTAKGVIRKVSYHRKSKAPKFEVFVEDTKETYTSLTLDYVLKYSLEVPLKYHELKAQYIVNLSRQAGSLWMPQAQQEEENCSNSPINTNSNGGNEAERKGKQKKRGGTAPRERGKQKQKTETASKPSAPNLEELDERDDLDFAVDSDAEEEDEESFWDAPDGEEDGLEENADPAFMNWQYNTPPVQHEKEFTGLSGPQHTLSPETAVPFDYFCLFIPMYMWCRIASYTNKKAAMASEEQDGKIRAWSPTCGAEIKAWYAAVLWWCLMKSCTFSQFFANTINPAVVSRWFPSFKRWQQIKRFLKVSDPSKDEENKHNKMYKVQELFDVFIQACKASFYPAREVAVDEAVKKFKGRCTFKQYIKGKPVRFGLKIYCVCCSATSYLFNCMFYLGKTDIPAAREASATQETVVQLMQPLSGKYHRVYMDNYYTGLPLFKELQDMDIHATGTVRTNRKGLDSKVTVKKDEEAALKKTPGVTRYSSCGRYVYAAWYDKRAVHMLSNCHQPVAGPEDVVQHWYPAKAGDENVRNGKVLKEISICPLVRWYRKWMGGVDRFDQLRAYIKLEMRTGKFWFPMMWFLLESAMVNAWILYKTTREKAGLDLHFDHFDFRVSVARALAAEWESMGCVFTPGTLESSPSKHVKSLHGHKLVTLLGTTSTSRFTAEDKHISCIEKIPLRDGQKDSKRRLMKCMAIGCPNRTSKWCKACHAPLCVPGCFVTYHSK